jgi:DNA mismatch repair protein MutL
MSGIIQLLPDHIANQIAAGEVIQRPASVVKELMENAIDAGAGKVQVVIKDAGKTLIQVTDDGRGMYPVDAVRCFDRHATSKIKTADDLYSLTTKGFRGEALASIAAIAHVTLRTRFLEEDTGVEIEMEGSQLKKNESCICPIGTTFEIKNLFFNVPARRNFLKSDSIEWNHIIDEFERIALAHPQIHFDLIHNNSEYYALYPGVLRKRIVDILGKNSADKLVPIEEQTEIVTIYGFVGKPEFAKKSRGEQFLFVNDRFFKDGYFNHAIGRAFEGLLQQKHLPSYFLYFTVNPQRIDVNVHPTKTEIKFEEDRSIYAILVSSIRQALGKYNIAPTLDFEQETGFDLPQSYKNVPPAEPIIQVDPHFNPFKTYSSNGGQNVKEKAFTPAIQAKGFGDKRIEQADWQAFYQIEDESVPAQSALIPDEHTNEIIVEDVLLHPPYFFVSTADELFIVHSKRAFIRVIYDQLMSQFLHAPIASQVLLFPYEYACTKQESREWESNEMLLSRLGFSATVREELIVLNAVPTLLHDDGIADCISLILEKIAYQSIDKGDVAHYIILSIAISESRKKGTSSFKEEAKDLFDRLMTSKEFSMTPDGKTILVKHTLESLTQHF